MTTGVIRASSVDGHRSDSTHHAESGRPVRGASRPPCTEMILAATAHELRLPLSHIKGFVTSLRRTDVEWDDETRNEFIAEIDLNASRLTELVDARMERATPCATVKPAPGQDVALIHPAAVVQ